MSTTVNRLGPELLADHQELLDLAVDAVETLQSLALERQDVLLDPLECGGEIRHQLLRADREDHLAGAERQRCELAPRVRGDHDRAVLGHRVGAVDVPVRPDAELAHRADAFRRAVVHRPGVLADRVIAAGFLDLLGDADELEGLRRALPDLGALRQDPEDDATSLVAVLDDVDGVALGAQPCGGSLDGRVIGALTERGFRGSWGRG